MSSLSLIFRAYSASRYSLAALLGAVEADSRLSGIKVEAPLENFSDSIRRHSQQGQTVVAFSVMSTQTKQVREEVSQILANTDGDVILIGGGPHASAKPRDLLEWGFNYVVVGEGEHVLPEILWRIETGADPESVLGVVTQESEDIPKPSMLPRVTLDNYPPFAIDLNIVGPVEVTRGCPFACKFCCTPFLTGGQVRHRSVDSVVSWLKRAVEKRGFRRTWFLSPNALCYGGRGRNVVMEKLEGLLKATTSIDGLDEVFFGSFPSEVRPEFVTSSVLEVLRQYVANETLQIGLQSGSNRVLEYINRHHTVEQGMDAIGTAIDCGFVPHVDMIFGLPGEERDDLRASIEICHELTAIGAKIHGHVFMPLPGSAFENMPPGRLDEETRRELGEMARKGVLTGSWSHQEDIAKDLAASRISSHSL